MIETFFNFTYRLLIWPTLRCAFSILALFNPKVREGLRLRKNHPWLQGPRETRPIWIHCASGEFEYAKPVIRELKTRKPDTRVLVTYFSPSFRDAVARFPGVDFSCPLPWDTEQDLQSFISYHRPTHFAIARTDTWPELLRVTKKNRIPSLLFSATLSRGAGRLRGPMRWVSRFVLQRLSQIYCVTKDDADLFSSLGLESETKCVGDTRYDQVLERLKNPKPIRSELFEDHKRPVLIAGSTWPEDEHEILQMSSELKSKLRLIVVPHEPSESHLAELEGHARARGWTTTRYSTARADLTSDTLLIVDKIGILAELYQYGDFAFVGGSFKKSVHSVMEALAAGLPTFVGPKHEGNREALLFSRKKISGQPCVVSVQDGRELTDRLNDAVQSWSPGAHAKIKAEIQSEIAAQGGASSQVVDWLLA